jgi:oxygen-independent coproporphyrinogen-3 oxidase
VSHLSWDIARRFDRPIPRYTSYPTVPHWGSADSQTVAAITGAVAARERDLAVYVHVPFCVSMCAYCGCNVVVSKSYEQVPRYLAELERELDVWRERLGGRRLVQLHLGGGTPTFLRPADLGALIGGITRRFPACAEVETGVEVDPSTASREHLRALRDAGVSRLSVGVQDFDDVILAPIGRGGRAALARRVIDDAHAMGFASINVDLMYGLPGQTPEHLARSAGVAAASGVHRAAVFGYAHVPQLRPHQKRLEKLGLPSPEARWQLAITARDAFTDAGFAPIGFDHYARHDDALAIAAATGRLRRNFQGYSVLGAADVLGVGASAVSDFGEAYVQNDHRLSRYYAAVDAGATEKERACRLSPDDQLRRRIIFDLMCHLAIDTSAYGGDFGTSFTGELERLRELAEARIVELGSRTATGSGAPDLIRVTDAGRPLLRTVALVFDSYAGAAQVIAAKAV